MGSDATGGTEPLLEAGTTELGMRLQGGWTGDSKKRSRVLELLTPPTRRPRVLGSQSGSQDQLVASQAAHAPGLSPGL